jgi:hypothetical protein
VSGSGTSGPAGSAGGDGSGSEGTPGESGTTGVAGSTGCGISRSGAVLIAQSYPKGVSSSLSRSSSIEPNTADAPASRSSSEEKPPVSTAMLSMPALFAASQS